MFRMIFRWLSPFGLISIFGLACFSSGRLAADDAALVRFKNAYPDALARLKRAYSNVDASGTLTRITRADNSGRGMKVDIRINDKLRKATVTSYDPGSGGEAEPAYRHVYCIGKDTTFVASRDFRKSDQFTIRDVENVTSAGVGPLNHTRMMFTTMAGKFLFSPYKTNLFQMEYLLNEGRYRITSAEEYVEDGEPVLRVHYASNKMRDGLPLTEGMAEVLPNRAWAMRHHEFNTSASVGTGSNARQRKLQDVVTVEYGDDQGGVPVPKRVQYRSTVTGEETLEFDKVVLGATTPEREFTLDYYELPDVMAPVADPSRSYVVYGIFGLSALALVAALLIRKRSQ